MQNQELGQQITNEVFQRLDAVAAKLGVAVEHLWEIFVRQSVIEGAVGASVALLVFLIAALTSFVTIRKRIRGESRWLTKAAGEEFPSLQGFLGVASTTIATISFVIICCCLGSWASHIFNPEFFAWQEVQRILR